MPAPLCVDEDRLPLSRWMPLKSVALAIRVISEAMVEVGSAYRDLKAILEANGRGDKAKEDARFVLPQAAETRIVVTMNCRALLHFFSLRCCNRAQWEIRAMADAMLDICKRELPAIFASAGARCETLGYCPEAERFACGKHPTLKQLLADKK